MNKFVNTLLVAAAVFCLADFAQAQGFGPTRPEDRPSWDRRPRHPNRDGRSVWDRRPRRPDWDRRNADCWDAADRVASRVVGLSHRVYRELDREIYRMDYDLRRTLQDLVDSAQDFRRSVERNRDFGSSVYELRKLERDLEDVVYALRYVREAREVYNEMEDLKDGVAELLYIFDL